MDNDYSGKVDIKDEAVLERTEEIRDDDDEVTGRTEKISTVAVGGRFDIILDVKKINTEKSIDD